MRLVVEFEVMSPLLSRGAIPQPPELRLSELKALMRLWWRRMWWGRQGPPEPGSDQVQRLRDEENSLFGGPVGSWGAMCRSRVRLRFLEDGTSLTIVRMLDVGSQKVCDGTKWAEKLSQCPECPEFQRARSSRDPLRAPAFWLINLGFGWASRPECVGCVLAIGVGSIARVRMNVSPEVVDEVLHCRQGPTFDPGSAAKPDPPGTQL